ncbi:hypothetical protein LOTGIDRAFT_235545 [Lottia gigantea]|uniref:Molybdenum cofactor sulfurase n=1 Tax=Lottia gigantea TaxID=225164 RepID=V4BB32_LOTGI|nr:hypothetical protein LOTGIDRAFT_235545 [Lottia gigantea]ESO86189.1 hypothetical protein LOTGIDRAFT_235545 [Lottia gigantea]
MSPFGDPSFKYTIVSSEKVKSEEVYLDHAATTLYSKRQIQAYQEDLLSHVYGNPHSRCPSSQLTADSIEQIRFRILRFFNTNSKEYSVIFTSGCTGALKLVAETFQFHSAHSNSTDNDRRLENCVKVDNSNHSDSDLNNGYFCYLLDNHTSAQGMRELAAKRTKNIQCLDTPDLSKCLICDFNVVNENSNNLFVFPAQSNFSGEKFPLQWIEDFHNGRMKCQERIPGQWFVLLDAASYVSTSYLNLGLHKPDFITLSFYKIFGFPTGLGALLVKNDSSYILHKEYFGGGTVAVSSAQHRFHIFRENISERFEDGTLPFLDIIALRHGFDAIEQFGGGIHNVSHHTFTIAQYLHHHLCQLYHYNDTPLVVIYGNGNFSDINTQGAIVNFNLKRCNSEFIGFAEVDKLAQLHKIHLRTGCFCNVGACQKYLDITLQQLQDNFKEGHVCGDDKDLINGLPTGSVRISFGYMSTLEDAQKSLQFLTQNNPQKQTTEKNDDVIKKCDEKTRLLTNIFLYPIKSCGAFEVSEWEITSKGLLYDRHWMIVSEAGVTISQKREPRLCLIKPFIDLHNNSIYLQYPEMPELCLSLDCNQGNSFTGEICTNKVCGDKVEMYDFGDEAGDWISLAINRSGCRLLQHKADHFRKCKLKDSSSDAVSSTELSLANESQFLLISRQSIKALLKKMSEENSLNSENGKEDNEQPLTMPDEENIMKRFRANFVIGGGLCFEEDNWSDISLGNNQMKSQGGCSRCQMICLDQNTGNRSKEPLKTLAVWRGRMVPFGIHLRMKILSENRNMVYVGDEVKTSSH